MAFNWNGRSSIALPQDSAGNPIYKYQEEGVNLIATADGTVTYSQVNQGTVGKVRVAGQQEVSPIASIPDRAGWYEIYNNSAAIVSVTVIGYNNYTGANVLATGTVTLNIPTNGSIRGDFTSILVNTASSTVVAYRKIP